jgi:hypothetical protein
VEAIGLHAGGTCHPSVNEFCCGYPPIKVKDIEKNTTNFVKSLSGIHFLENPFSNPPLPPLPTGRQALLKGSKRGSDHFIP